MSFPQAPPSTFRPMPLPVAFVADAADQKRWAHTLLEVASDLGFDHLRVQRRADGAPQKGSGPWFNLYSEHGPSYNLRAVLPNMLAFDVGDNKEDGSPTPWEDTVEFTHAIWNACRGLGIPFHGGLSGGKGTHTEVWLAPFSGSRLDVKGACGNCQHAHLQGFTRCQALLLDDSQCACRHWDRPFEQPIKSTRRWQIAYAILGAAHEILGRRLDFDPRLIDPNEGSRMFREWGELKQPGNPKRKLLWIEPGEPIVALPFDQEEAYRVAEARVKARGRSRPASISTSAQVDTHDTLWVRDLFGGPGCPQGPQCREPVEGWSCSDCPIWR